MSPLQPLPEKYATKKEFAYHKLIPKHKNLYLRSECTYIRVQRGMNAPYWMKISKQQNKHTFGLNKFQFICVNHLFCVIFSLISSEKEFELGRWGFWRAYEGNPHKSIRTLCARFWQPIFGFAAYLLICIIFFSTPLRNLFWHLRCGIWVSVLVFAQVLRTHMIRISRMSRVCYD